TGRRGGQHHVQHLFIDTADAGGYRVTSYWVSIRWDTQGDKKFMRAMGSYVDTCVQVDGKWLIKEKIIDPWNSETPPMVRAKGQARRSYPPHGHAPRLPGAGRQVDFYPGGPRAAQQPPG